MADEFFEFGITELLKAAQPVTDIAGEQLFWVNVDQNAGLNYLRLQVVDDLTEKTLTSTATFSKARLQVDSVADSYKQAKRLSRAVYDTLNGFVGMAGGVLFQELSAIDKAQDIPNVDAEKKRVFTVSQDFRVWYKFVTA